LVYKNALIAKKRSLNQILGLLLSKAYSFIVVASVQRLFLGSGELRSYLFFNGFGTWANFGIYVV